MRSYQFQVVYTDTVHCELEVMIKINVKLSWLRKENNKIKQNKINKELILYTSPLYKYISFVYRQSCNKTFQLIINICYNNIKNFAITVTIVIVPKFHLELEQND